VNTCRWPKDKSSKNGNITARKVLGYDVVNKKLIVNEREAKIVRFIFETYKNTRNYYKTAQICNAKGYAGKKGQAFHASSIKTIVQNRIYCGFNNFHGEESKKGNHKAIISQKMFSAVNALQTT